MDFDNLSEVNAAIFSLWRKGMLDVSFDEDGDPMVGLTESSYDELQQKSLDDEELEVLLDILEVWEEMESD